MTKMIKCKNECPKGLFNGCCVCCSERETCDEVCEQAANYENCEDAINEETALIDFKNENLAVIQNIADICTQKKQLEETEKKMKDALKQAMEEYGIKKFESDILNITYVAESQSTSVDSAKLKKLYPQIADECSKTSKRSAYIKVEVK